MQNLYKGVTFWLYWQKIYFVLNPEISFQAMCGKCTWNPIHLILMHSIFIFRKMQMNCAPFRITRGLSHDLWPLVSHKSSTAISSNEEMLRILSLKFPPVFAPSFFIHVLWLWILKCRSGGKIIKSHTARNGAIRDFGDGRFAEIHIQRTKSAWASLRGADRQIVASISVKYSLFLFSPPSCICLTAS